MNKLTSTPILGGNQGGLVAIFWWNFVGGIFGGNRVCLVARDGQL